MFALVGLFLSSCSVVDIASAKQGDKKTAPLLGKTYSEVLSMMGKVPDRIQEDGNGGKILVFEEITQYSSGVAVQGEVRTGLFSTAPGVASNTKTMSDRVFVEAWINPDNVCYKVNDNWGYDVIYDTHKEKRGWYRVSWFSKFLVSYGTLGMMPIFYGIPSNVKCHKWFNAQSPENQRTIAVRLLNKGAGKAKRWYNENVENNFEDAE